MKMKNKGLGRIPKSLSWIGSVEEEMTTPEVTHTQQPEVQREDVRSEVKLAPAAVIEPTQEKTSTQKGLPTGWIRATFIVDQDLNEKVKALAYWDRLTVKEVMHEALSLYFQDKNVKPIPKKRSTI